MRQLGLTVAEIRDLARIYQDKPQEPIGPRIAERLRLARIRIERRSASSPHSAAASTISRPVITPSSPATATPTSEPATRPARLLTFPPGAERTFSHGGDVDDW